MTDLTAIFTAKATELGLALDADDLAVLQSLAAWHRRQGSPARSPNTVPGAGRNSPGRQ